MNARYDTGTGGDEGLITLIGHPTIIERLSVAAQKAIEEEMQQISMEKLVLPPGAPRPAGCCGN